MREGTRWHAALGGELGRVDVERSGCMEVGGTWKGVEGSGPKGVTEIWKTAERSGW